jgi:hypothetical protein
LEPERASAAVIVSATVKTRVISSPPAESRIVVVNPRDRVTIEYRKVRPPMTFTSVNTFGKLRSAPGRSTA